MDTSWIERIRHLVWQISFAVFNVKLSFGNFEKIILVMIIKKGLSDSTYAEELYVWSVL